MIITISGKSCTGKTLMAQTLLEKYKVPYLSIDHLKMGLYRADNNCGFTPLGSDQFIGEKLWPILKSIIQTNIENNQHLIIEGCYLLPHHLQDFEPVYADKIIAVFLGFSASYIEEQFHSSIVKHCNVIESRIYPEERTISKVLDEHKYFREECLACGVPYFEIKQDYEVEISNVYEYIETEKCRMESVKPEQSQDL
ncbi:2-phosphoglycerate kinase [Paenibacillus sambharensis]|uniref:2-phosphoglycerate kinase n=1 Tax=Paenibacillus sambharensis TaxID=1803190 RepID=A0A2W1LQS2_9BACL|nr:2-phosphoglycerate kinase [Paenibacillus sambharensis]PZD97302.1 2-phosphoglycerate kinase [Paenibacillus sambharensis]